MARKPATPADDAETGDRPGRDNGVQVLARAAEILRLLKSSPGGLSQAEISNTLLLARSTVHRILSALAAEGLVEQSGTSSRFRLGQEILRMAEAARSALVTVIHPLLQSLSRELNETVDLSVLDRNQITFIDQVVAAQRLRTVSVIGASFPLYCTANGKAVLAAMSEKELERVLPPDFEAMTPATLTSLAALKTDLARVRKSGVAYDLEEHSLGVCAVGVVLADSPLGYAALSIPIPVQRFEDKKDAAATALKRTVSLIETLWRKENGEA